MKILRALLTAILMVVLVAGLSANSTLADGGDSTSECEIGDSGNLIDAPLVECRTGRDSASNNLLEESSDPSNAQEVIGLREIVDLLDKYHADHHVKIGGNDNLYLSNDPQEGILYRLESERQDAPTEQTDKASSRVMSMSLPVTESHNTMTVHGDGDVALYKGDSYDIAVHPSLAGFSSYVIIHDKAAPTSYEFHFELPKGFTMSEHESGGVDVLDADARIIAVIAAPWAFDANGEVVPTRYDLQGNILTQTVDHAGATYPIIADPNYYAGYTKLNSAEKSWCRWPSRWSLCKKAYNTHANSAIDSTEELFGEQGHNDESDAHRHCYWSARMTIDFGSSHAKGFGDRHEELDFSIQPLEEKEMDLANNEHGRRAGAQVADYSAAESRCHNWSKDGTLQTSP